jgi:hypothetical protein
MIGANTFRHIFQTVMLSLFMSFSYPAYSQDAPVATELTPKEHVRTVDQTFLTFPEWFLVFSPAELADHLKNNRPSSFPFIGHIGQFWSSYKAVTEETVARKMPFNAGYHLMVMVIGVSTTIEYAIKFAYESTIGRLTEGFTFQQIAEDKFAAQYAQDYVDFIRDLPWYQFDFVKQLRSLWAAAPNQEGHSIRKWERRFSLTTELLLKAGYGKLIGLATGSIYDTPLLVTSVVVTPAEALIAAKSTDFPDIKELKQLSANQALITIPRYEKFTTYARQLAQANLNFVEIAGNQTIILVSLIGPQNWAPTLTDKVLIEQPILTLKDRKRIVATVNVKDLAQALRTWSAQQVQVEHLFDY